MIWNDVNISGIDMGGTAKKISKLIDESGLSDRQLGEIMGISVQSINKWRHGRNLPDIENLFVLSKIIGIKIDDFLVPSEAGPQLNLEFQPEVEKFSISTIRRLREYYFELIRILKVGEIIK